MDRLRWGVMSTANIAIKKVIPGIRRSSNGDVVAIASRVPERAEEIGEQLGIPVRFGSYEDLLASDEIDAVYIPLPNQLHKEWTLAAARARKHVLCEKPLALTAADAQDMVDGCSEAGVVFMEAFMYRLHPTWRKAVELIEAGRIGEPRALVAAFAFFTDDPRNIRNQLECGGGALMDIGCYPINAARMVFGSEPTEVSASMVRHPRFGTDILTSAVLGFDDRHAVFTVSTMSEPAQFVHIIGSKARIEIDIPFNVPADRETRIHLVGGGTPPVAPDRETFSFAPIDQYAIEAELFAAAVIDGTPVPTPPSDGVATMAVIERIRSAAQP